MSLSCEFHCEFREQYLRRNPSKGSRTLRCFPSCSLVGHRNNSFCGTPVEAILSGDEDFDGVFATLALEDDTRDILTVGSIVPSIPVRSVNSPLEEVIQGSRNQNVVTFNEGLFPWNYHWISHRHRTDQKHALYIITTVTYNTTSFRITQVHKSPSFDISSRKRTSTSKSPNFDIYTKRGNPCSALSFAGISSWLIGSEFLKTGIAMKTNRVLDRLYILSMGPPCSQVPTGVLLNAELDDKEILSNHIQNIFTEHGVLNAKFGASSIMNILRLAVSLFRNNAMIEDWFKRFTTKFGTPGMFEQLIEREVDSNFEWTPEHEDEVFGAPESVENSIYADFRNACRSVMRRSVEMAGVNLEDLQSPMECLSANGALRNDPFYPPSIADASYLHSQVHGNATSDGFYGEGHSTFPDDQCHKNYGKDLLLWRRSSSRKRILDNFKSQTGARWVLDASTKLSMSPEFDMNGTYVDCALQKEAYPPLKCMTGLLQGLFAARMVKRMFAQIAVVTTPTMFHLRASSWSFGAASITIVLDGKIHPFSPPYPLDFLIHFMPDSKERQVAGSFHRETKSDGQVVGSAVFVFTSGMHVSKESLFRIVPLFLKSVPEAFYKLVCLKQFSKRNGFLTLTHYDFLFPIDFEIDLTLSFDSWTTDAGIVKYLALIEEDRFTLVQKLNHDLLF